MKGRREAKEKESKNKVTKTAKYGCFKSSTGAHASKTMQRTEIQTRRKGKRATGREWKSEKEKEKQIMEKKEEMEKKNWATSVKMNQNNTLKAQVA